MTESVPKDAPEPGRLMSDAWQIHEVDWPVDTPAAAERFADGGELAWLDSSTDAAADVHARFSMICARPPALLEQFDGRPATFSIDGVARAEDASGWRLWRRALSSLPPCPPTAWDLSPGWVGYIGFEMARQLERLPCSHREDLGLPLLRLGLFDRAIVLDHRQHQAFAVRACGVREALGIAKRDADADWMERWQLAAAARRTFGIEAVPRLRHEVTQRAHERAVARALEYIAAGDIYQVNLAQRLCLEGVGEPLSTYAAMRQANPAPYAALLRWEGGAIASVSPELFLRVHGQDVLTRPIKGTRPHTHDQVRDEVFRRQLLGSEKEAAELAMIVDLHRNDLGRVCTYGSVRVTHPRRLEAHPTVFHTVADVVGRLKPGRDGLDLLAACFPTGSVTGVPKIRAIEVIDELEPAARGAYTGAVGVLGLDGQMTFNVAIRTLQIRDETATLYVGGGIVADSDPTAEYEETLAKGRGILQGIMEDRLLTADPRVGRSLRSGSWVNGFV